MKKNQLSRHEYLTQTPIPKLTLTLAVPGVLGLLVATLYNTVDTWFVSHLGTLAVGACGVVYSIMEAISAIGYLFGMGGGVVIGTLLGAKKKDEAAEIGTTAFCTTLIFGTAMAVLGLCFMTPLMRFLGASDELMPDAIAYGTYILIGFPIMSGALVLSTMLRCEGMNRECSIGTIFGAVLNIALDPLFIFVLNLGVAGASLATLISQLGSLILLLSYYLSGRTEMKLRLSAFRPTRSNYRQMLVTGLPSLCRHMTMTVGNIAMNTFALAFGGELMIAALTIVTKINLLIQSVIKGVYQAMQTIFSFNKGAGRNDRVKEAFRFALSFNMLLIVVFAIPVCIFSKQILSIFGADNPELIALGGQAMIFVMLSLLFSPFNLAANMLLQSTGAPLWSTLLAALPTCLCYVPALYVMSALWQATGVLTAPIVAQGLTAAVSLPLIIAFFRRMDRESKQA